MVGTPFLPRRAANGTAAWRYGGRRRLAQGVEQAEQGFIPSHRPWRSGVGDLGEGEFGIVRAIGSLNDNGMVHDPKHGKVVRAVPQADGHDGLTHLASKLFHEVQAGSPLIAVPQQVVKTSTPCYRKAPVSGLTLDGRNQRAGTFDQERLIVFPVHREFGIGQRQTGSSRHFLP